MKLTLPQADWYQQEVSPMAVLQCNNRRTVNETKLFENLLYVQMIVETDSRAS